MKATTEQSSEGHNLEDHEVFVNPNGSNSNTNILKKMKTQRAEKHSSQACFSVENRQKELVQGEEMKPKIRPKSSALH